MGNLSFGRYAVLCAREAIRGVIDNANNWAWILGAGIPALISGWKIHLMVIAPGPWQPVEEGIWNVGFAYIILLLVRLFIWAPYQLWKAEKARGAEREKAAKSNGLKDELDRRRTMLIP